MVTKKEEVEVLEAEVVDYILNPDLEFKEPSKKKPRGKRKKDFPMFTESTRTAILAVVMKGAPIETAAQVAGVKVDTVYSWLERGQMVADILESGDEERIEDIADVEMDFAKFYIQYNKAQAFAEVRLIDIITDATEDDPKLAMQWLGRINPRYSSKQQIHMTGDMRHGHVHVSAGKLPEGEGLAKRLPTKDLKALRANLVKDKQKLLEAGEIDEDDEE